MCQAHLGDPPGSGEAARHRKAFRLKEEDRELIARARKGDEGAYRTLLDKYDRPVYNICLRMCRNTEEARDLAQDAFVKVFGMLERYDARYAFSSWLFKITYNLCIDSMRKRQIDTTSMDAPVSGETGEFQRQFESPTDDPEKVMMKKEKMGLLMEGIESLPEHYRIMILLRHQEDLSYEEIAETLEVPLGTVKARIHRAREMLKAKLQGKDFW